MNLNILYIIGDNYDKEVMGLFSKWMLEGFKSIYDYTEFELFPMTVFTGANSSGKSSVIQSILLSTQTLQNNIHTKPIILNGQIVRLGNYYDIHSHNSKDSNITVGFELEIDEQDSHRGPFFSLEDGEEESEHKLISCKYKFTVDDDMTDSSALQPIISESSMSVFNKEKSKKYSEIKIIRSNVSVENKANKLGITNVNEKSIESLQYDISSSPKKGKREADFSNFSMHWSNKINEEYVGADLLHFIPKRIVSRINKNEFDAYRILNYLIEPLYVQGQLDVFKNLVNEKFLTELDNIVNGVLEGNYTINEPRLSRIFNYYNVFKDELNLNQYKEFYMLLPVQVRRNLMENLAVKSDFLLNTLLNELEAKYVLYSNPRNGVINNEYITQIAGYFNNKVKYLGPLRDEPKPIYPNTGSLDSKDVGYKGEYTAAVLELHKDTIVEYIEPQNLNGDNYEIKQVKLIQAVLEWLNYMGISSEVQTVDRGKLGHELQVKLNSEGKFNDLTNVGVGVSQVLPILVLSLLSEKNSTIIFEQPELHLHPKVQTRLADFFVTMVHLKKQCILETHSEYLINRLRYKAVSSAKDKIQENVMIYFVEQEEGKSNYRPIQINEFGVIEDWPKGFFDEHERIATEILKAARLKSKGGRNCNM